MFNIGARLLFNAKSAVFGFRQYRRSAYRAKITTLAYMKTANDLGVSLSKVLAIQRDARAPTHFQRNLRLINTNIRTVIYGSKELRSVWKEMNKAMHSSYSPVRRATDRMREFGKATNTVKSEIMNLVSKGLTALSHAFGGLEQYLPHLSIGDMLSGSIKLAATQEGALITFRTMLGSQARAEEMMKRIGTYASATPFNKSDIVGSSKRLLDVSGNDIDKNERLFKLAANVAALRPGRKVEDVAMGIVNATVGEFEILKGGFGIRLSEAMFQKKGVAKGTKAYSDAVVEEIARQIDAKGGEALVEALSTSITGRISTFQDNIEDIGTTIGTALVKSISFADSIGEINKVFGDLSGMISMYVTGTVPEGLDLFDVSDTVDMIAWAVSQSIKSIGVWAKWIKEKIVEAWKAFDGMSRPAKKAILSVFGLFLGGGSISTAVSGVVSAMAAVGTAIAAVVFATSDVLLPAIGAAIALTAPALSFALWGFLTLAGAFVIFRDEGESVLDTMKRLAVGVGSYLWLTLQRLWAFMSNMFIPIWVHAKAGLKNFQQPIRELHGALYQLFDYMGIGSAGALGEFADAGRNVGAVLGWLLETALWMAAGVLKAFTWLVKATMPVTRTFVSDIKKIIRAFLDLLSGSNTAKESMKTIMLGLFDVITIPLREVLRTMFLIVADGINVIEKMVRPLSTTVAKQVGGLAEKVRGAAEDIREGLLSTEALTKMGAVISVKLEDDLELVAETPVEMKLDTDKLADGMAKHKVRKKANTGDSGIGFILENGKIRQVGFNEVLGE